MIDQKRHRGRSAGLALAAALLLAVLAAPTAAASVVSVPASGSVRCTTPTTAPAGGIDMSASVVGPTASPCTPSAGGPGSPPAPGSNASGGARGASGGGASTPQPSSVSEPVEAPVLTGEEFDLGGIIIVGGLSSEYRPSPNPFGGDMQLWFTVRNVSDTAIDGRVDFWMQSVFGNRVGEVDGVAVTDLKPGEMRTVSADVPGVGQWTVLNAHAVLTPPEEVDGVQLSPLQRDATAFAMPWFILILVVVTAGSTGVVLLVRRQTGLGPIAVPA